MVIYLRVRRTNIFFSVRQLRRLAPRNIAPLFIWQVSRFCLRKIAYRTRRNRTRRSLRYRPAAGEPQNAKLS